MSDLRALERCHSAQCGRCGAALLVGYAGGMSVRVDARPITPRADRLYAIAGRMTFDLTHGELNPVSRDFSAAPRPGRLTFVQHRCGAGPPATMLEPLPPPPPQSPVFDGEFPF